MEEDEDTGIQTITLAAHESEMVREHKTLRLAVAVLAAGWLVSVLVLGAVIYAYATAEYEVTTETTTTETTTTTDENNANSGDSGVAYAGDGDLTVGDSE